MRALSPYLLAALFVATSLWHLARPAFFVRLTPPWVPRPYAVNAAVAALEACLAAGLFFERSRPAAALAAALFFMAVSPVHWRMLKEPGASMGLPRWALWARLAAQLLLILWAAALAVR